jgi:putative PIN family toxin of toxin-antitoxin system
MTQPDGIPWAVLDTNILVSSLLSDGPPALIVDWVAAGRIRPCFDDRILSEYWDVLSRPKFGFCSLQINRLIHDIVTSGFGIEVPAKIPLEETKVSGGVSIPDESDRKFYDVARIAEAILITGNIKHYPNEPFIFTPADFVQRYYINTGQS